ncbi:hypothetical protein HRR99_17255 [Agrobacterium vaccinii]|uniref:hypothetical protein n=1 Tax=Agrobacterium vaccinii TaxID=2735528 RepID=UPI000DD93610|nr:hypothetical protein [Agrobacterium vaccinii]UHS63337.1 hypothetical protein HRR99_17255 [Agrobacterium vaccinii]
MFDFLKTAAPSTVFDFEDETGTYADALLQVPDVEASRVTAREYGHEAHMRDYGAQREVARNSLGFA